MIKYPLTIIFLLVSAVFANAGTYYVSNSTSSTNWSAAQNIGTPCTPATSMTNAVANDTVYFRGGMYDVGDSPNWETPALKPSNSGSSGSPITFKAYPDETPVVKVSDSCSDCQAAIGSRNEHYIIWDGFTVDTSTGPVKWKGLFFNDSNSSTVQNCIFIGKSSSETDNIEGIRLNSSNNITIKNCKIYDYEQVDDYANTSAIKMYGSDYPIIENCEIYDCACGIRPKDEINHGIFRYNYIHDCHQAFLVSSVESGDHMDCGKVYHNVFATHGYFAIQIYAQNTGTTDGWEIYNNTIYNSGRGISYSVGHSKVWNNIIQGCADNQYIGFYTGAILDESDHNQFGTSSLEIITRLYAGDQGTYTSLASWQSSGELDAAWDAGCGSSANPGCGSLVSNPLFQNASGNYTDLDDFKLASGSPCIDAGRGGVDMGADIDLVGLDAGGGDGNGGSSTGSVISGGTLSGCTF